MCKDGLKQLLEPLVRQVVALMLRLGLRHVDVVNDLISNPMGQLAALSCHQAVLVWHNNDPGRVAATA
jgi:hypothetical protein